MPSPQTGLAARATTVPAGAAPAVADRILVRSGRVLDGTAHVSGATDSALTLMAAALMAPGCTTLTNVPRTADIGAMADVLADLGIRVAVDPGRWDDVVTVDVPDRIGDAVTPDAAGRLRASIVVLGPLVARTGHAVVPRPGGRDLASRGIELAADGLAAMGADVAVGADHVEVTAPAGGLAGADIELARPSMGATATLVMAAVLARGTTRVRNVARQPEIGDLIAFLRGLGGRISGDGSPELVVEGVGALRPCAHHIVGDRIEAGTFAVAAALTGGDVTIEGVDPTHLRRPLNRLAAAGVRVRTTSESIRVLPGAALVAADVATMPYPGFPTDLLAPYQVLLSQAVGQSLVTENVDEGRFGLVGQLARMGLDAAPEGHHVVIRGPQRLRGAQVDATDLRAGAALVLAGLVADGETCVREVDHVDRGDTDLVGKLRAIGADVDRVAG